MSRGSNILLIFTCAFFFVFFPRVAKGYEIPRYEGLVNDFAQVIPDDEELALEKMLTQEAERELGIEIAVVTITSLNGEAADDVALQFFDTWEIGKTQTDTGVVILLSTQDRAVRIQTGYGAEAFLTDAESGRIIDNVMIPSLQKGEYAQAVQSAALQIIVESKTIDQNELVNESQSDSALARAFKSAPIDVGASLAQFGFFGGIVLTYLISFLGRSKSWWTGGIVGGIAGYILWSMQGVIVLGILGLILDYILSKNYTRWNLEHKTTSWRSTWGGFKSGSGKSFTFGGGRSGGGGAMRRW